MEAVREGLQSWEPNKNDKVEHAPILEELTALVQEMEEWDPTSVLHPPTAENDETTEVKEEVEMVTNPDEVEGSNEIEEKANDLKRKFDETTAKLRQWLNQIQSIIQRCANFATLSFCCQFQY